VEGGEVFLTERGDEAGLVNLEEFQVGGGGVGTRVRSQVGQSWAVVHAGDGSPEEVDFCAGADGCGERWLLCILPAWSYSCWHL
jgi:hypothetical protein